jgi:hypothetical protein
MSDYIEHACGWCGSLLHHVDKCSTKDNPSDDQRRIHYLQSRLTSAETRIKELERTLRDKGVRNLINVINRTCPKCGHDTTEGGIVSNEPEYPRISGDEFIKLLDAALLSDNEVESKAAMEKLKQIKEHGDQVKN